MKDKIRWVDRFRLKKVFSIFFLKCNSCGNVSIFNPFYQGRILPKGSEQIGRVHICNKCAPNVLSAIRILSDLDRRTRRKNYIGVNNQAPKKMYVKRGTIIFNWKVGPGFLR